MPEPLYAKVMIEVVYEGLRLKSPTVVGGWETKPDHGGPIVKEIAIAR